MLILYKCLFYASVGLISILGIWCVLLFGSFLLIFGNPIMWILLMGGLINEVDVWKDIFSFYMWSCVITLFGAPNIAVLLMMSINYFGELIGAA